jgi:hypothetical protein
VLGIVVKDGAWLGNLLGLGSGKESHPLALWLPASIDGRLNEEGARDGATENVGLFVGNLVLVGACEELGDGGRVGLGASVPETSNDG